MKLHWKGGDAMIAGYGQDGIRRAMITLDPRANGKYAGWLETNPGQRQCQMDDREELKQFLEGLIPGDPR